MTINDSAGGDTYDVGDNYYYLYINDDAGNDKYNFKNSYEGYSIVDKKGNDKYYSANSDNSLYFQDYEGKDNYSITSTNTRDVVKSGNLFIFDKVNNGCIKIDGFFETQEIDECNFINYGTTNWGCIETIKARKKNISNDIIEFSSEQNLLQLAQITGNWLSTEGHKFDDVSHMFNNATDEQMADFIATLAQGH